MTTRIHTTKPLAQQIRRSVAAQMLGVSSVTVYRYERAGHLTPYRRNSRLTLYDLAEVEKIQREGIPALKEVVNV